jgi:hypothetical protein
MQCRQPQYRRGIRDGHLGVRRRPGAGRPGSAGQSLAKRLEARHLQRNLGASRIVGGREVCHQPQCARLQGLQALPCGGGLLGPEAEPIHAAVHLEPQVEAMFATPGLQQRHGNRFMDHQVEAVACRRGQLRGIQHTLEQHDAALEARIAQQYAFLEPCHGQRVRALQDLRRGHEAVSVGIGLHHRHDA